MVSFIVPAYNEELELSRTLAAIRDAASGAGQRYEIIVVDDASTDATPKIASHFGARVSTLGRGTYESCCCCVYGALRRGSAGRRSLSCGSRRGWRAIA